MMELPFKCLSCDNEFVEVDEVEVVCPNCNKSDVKVEWGNVKY